MGLNRFARKLFALFLLFLYYTVSILLLYLAVLTPTRRRHNQSGYHLLAHHGGICGWWRAHERVNHVVCNTHNAH